MKNKGLSKELRYEIYKGIKGCGNIWGERDKIHEGISAVEFLNR